MMGDTSIGNQLADVLPKLRIKLQITGLAVMVVTSLLLHFAQPGNTAAMLTGGAIGICIIIFAQLFHFLRDFAESSRAPTFLGSFAMFVLVVLSLLAVTVMLLGRPSMTVTLELDALLGASKSVPFEGRSSLAQNSAFIWNTAATLAGLPTPFASDRDDNQLRQEAEAFGMGVIYTPTEKDGVLEITATMPYERKMHGEGFITPLTVNRFRWLPPVLSFKVSNPRSQLLVISKADIEAASVSNEDRPILIVDDVMPAKHGMDDTSEAYFPLTFYNVSWGLVRTPTLEFLIVRNADVEKAALGPFMYSVKARTFDGEVTFDLSNYIDKAMPRERVATKTVVSEMASWSDAVNFSAGDSIEYLNVIGRLSFLTEQREDRVVNFRAKLYFSHFAPGRINPSYKYNVFLPSEQKDFPVIIPLSQCILGHSADNFLIAFRSRKSTRYDLNISLHSTDIVILSQRIVLHTMVSRNYGLAPPQQAFSEKQGCT
jgi:hypothetical protein